MTIVDIDALTPAPTLAAADQLIAEGRDLLAVVAGYVRRSRPVLNVINEVVREQVPDTTYTTDGEVEDDTYDRSWPLARAAS